MRYKLDKKYDIITVDVLNEKLMGLDHPFRIAEYKHQNRRDPFFSKQISCYLMDFAMWSGVISFVTIIASFVFAKMNATTKIGDLLIGAAICLMCLSTLALIISHKFQRQYDDFLARVTFASMALGYLSVELFVTRPMAHLSEDAMGSLINIAKAVIQSGYDSKKSANFDKALDSIIYLTIIPSISSAKSFYHFAELAIEEEANANASTDTVTVSPI